MFTEIKGSQCSPLMVSFGRGVHPFVHHSSVMMTLHHDLFCYRWGGVLRISPLQPSLSLCISSP